MTCYSSKVAKQRRPKIFRYEASREIGDNCCEQVEQVWNHGPKHSNAVSQIQQLLGKCAKGLKLWGANKNRETMAAIKELSVKLKSLQYNEHSSIIEEEKRVPLELNSLLDKEELKWKQQAKRNWNVHEERYTKFFHACVAQRRKNNPIRKISIAPYQTLYKAEGIKEAFCAFFDDLFTSSNLSSSDIARCTYNMTCRLTEEMNQKLNTIFTIEEVKIALK